MSRLASRDDFSKKTVDLLARRAGGKCSMCGCSTWGPNDKPYSATNIGQAAHITAAAEGGPRYDSSLSSEMRSSIKNGLWLCSNCHDNVDRNPETFTVKKLREIKEIAETRARRELGVASPLQTSPTQLSRDPLAVIISGVAIVEVRKIKAQLSIYHKATNQKPSLDELKSLLDKIDFINFNEEGVVNYLPSVANEIINFLQVFSGYHDNPSIKLEVIRYLSDITFHYLPELDVTNVCETLKYLATGHTPRQPIYQSVLAFLKDLSQRVPKDHSNYKIVKSAMETVAKQRSRRGRAEVHESIDYYSGEEMASKVPRIEQDEEEERYLERMSRLATVTYQEGEEIEREVSHLGFEYNIL